MGQSARYCAHAQEKEELLLRQSAARQEGKEKYSSHYHCITNDAQYIKQTKSNRGHLAYHLKQRPIDDASLRGSEAAHAPVLARQGQRNLYRHEDKLGSHLAIKRTRTTHVLSRSAAVGINRSQRSNISLCSVLYGKPPRMLSSRYHGGLSLPPKDRRIRCRKGENKT